MSVRKQYHLYVVRPEDIPEGEPFFLITAKYSLLYTANRPPKRSREISDLAQLPALAMEWLKTSIDQIRAEYLAENEREILRRGKEFTERFAAELAAEREKLEKKEGTDGA